VAKTWLKLTATVFGRAKDTVLAADTADPRVAHLLNSGLATAVADPGSAPDLPVAVDPALSADKLITSPDGVSQSGLWMPNTRSLTPPSRVITRFPAGHGWTGGADDTTVKLFTDRSYRITTNGSGGNAYLTSPVMAAINCSGSSLRLVFRVNNAARLANVSINAKTDGSNLYQGSVQVNAITDEWAVVTLARSTLTAIGAPNWASITQFDVFVSDKGGAAPLTFYLAAVELVPDLAATYPSGVFILEADDGYPGQKSNLAAVVAQRGIPVTYNVITDRFTGGTPASGMTAADLRAFQDKYGWQVSCHAYAGADHDGNPSTAAVMEASFLRQKHWLHANGLHAGADHYALCPGTGSPVAEGAMLDAIIRNFRSARVNSGFYETAVPGDPMRLRSILFTGNTNAQLQANINAVSGAGGALIFTLHDVLAGGTNGTSAGLSAMGATNLATILDYAASRGMVFRTRADYLDGR
jgi:hypothetical protein